MVNITRKRTTRTRICIHKTTLMALHKKFRKINILDQTVNWFHEIFPINNILFFWGDIFLSLIAVWKFQDFSDTQFLCEINFEKPPRLPFLSFFRGSKWKFGKFQLSKCAKIHKNQQLRGSKCGKMADF